MSGRDRTLHVAVIVLGDIGRSPRMQYHALSLLEAGHTVSLVSPCREPPYCRTLSPLINVFPTLVVLRYGRLDMTERQSYPHY